MLRILIVVLTIAIGFTFGPASAQEKAPKAQKWKVEFKELPKPMQIHIMKALKEKDIDSGRISYASSSTKNCPSGCNDSSGGGYCFCKPDSNGECGAGETKGGSPGSEYCKIAMPKINIGINGVPEPIVVQMP